MCLSEVIPSGRLPPEAQPVVKQSLDAASSPREQLANSIANIFEMQRKVKDVS